MTDDHAGRSVALAVTLGGFLAAQLTLAEVATALGCADDQATRVLVCREPRHFRWRSDVATIARLAEVDAGALGRPLRR